MSENTRVIYEVRPCLLARLLVESNRQQEILNI
jgi:hypothetical protein